MKIAYILNAFPVLTQTWIPAEIRGLIALENDVSVVALGESSAPVDEAQWSDLAERRWIVPTKSIGARLTAFFHHAVWLFRSPFRYLRIIRFVVTHFNFQILTLFFITPRIATRIREDRIEWMHSHFADQGPETAMLVNFLTGVPYSFTPHAHDLWQQPRLLAGKMRHAAVVTSISEHNRNWCAEQFPELGADHFPVVRMGIDLERFSRREASQTSPNNPIASESGTPGPESGPESLSGNGVSARPFRVVTVGRLIPKKGHNILIKAALDLLSLGKELELRIIGEGPLLDELSAKVRRAGELRDEPTGEAPLGDRCDSGIRFLGPRSAEEVQRELREADLFALACRRAESGDMDGIPVSLMEAMAVELPVLTTRLSGIPELVEDGLHGRLVEPYSETGFTTALEELIDTEPETLRTMGRAGREKVERHYDSNRTVQDLHELLHRMAGQPDR